MVPDPKAWDPWPPRLIADRLADVDMPWYVAGGWAIDLFRGAPTRDHEDTEIAVPAERFGEVATRFPECDFYVAGGGRQVPVSPEALRAHYQTWAWDQQAGAWRFDVFREPHDGGMWIYRRDQRIRRPYADIIRRSRDGVPYLSPDVVLLFKAKADREKDRADFAGTLPLLSTDERRWLDEALAIVHPDHPWRDHLR